jgi:hypothetical protein
MSLANLNFDSDVAYLYNTARLCMDEGTGYDGVKQIAPLFASIPYSEESLQHLQKLEQHLFYEFPELVKFGRLRAKKAYKSEKDTITKPSYIGRLRAFQDEKIDQIENIVRIAQKEPASGGLCFSVFTPQDLLNRRRPGYVPCLVSGSFLLHDQKLQLNAFFRSQSIIEFGIYDLIFLREFQIDLLNRLIGLEVYSNKITPGNLNLFLARAFIHRRLMKKKDGTFVRRADVFNQWISAVYSQLLMI